MLHTFLQWALSDYLRLSPDFFLFYFTSCYHGWKQYVVRIKSFKQSFSLSLVSAIYEVDVIPQLKEAPSNTWRQHSPNVTPSPTLLPAASWGVLEVPFLWNIVIQNFVLQLQMFQFSDASWICVIQILRFTTEREMDHKLLWSGKNNFRAMARKFFLTILTGKIWELKRC